MSLSAKYGGKREGLTLLMIPARAPGVEIRAIETMKAHTVNDVFFTGVRMPASAVVGRPRNAWKQLMRGLGVERLIISAMSLGSARPSGSMTARRTTWRGRVR